MKICSAKDIKIITGVMAASLIFSGCSVNVKKNKPLKENPNIKTEINLGKVSETEFDKALMEKEYRRYSIDLLNQTIKDAGDNGNVMISLSKTLCDAKSVIAMDLSLDYLQKITEDVASYSESDIELIIDRRYNVIAHSDRTQIGENYFAETGTLGKELVEKLRKTDADSFSLKYNGEEYIVYRAPAAEDWECISVYNATSVLGQMRKNFILSMMFVI